MGNEEEQTQANAVLAVPRTKVLKNGSIYDLDKGRIVGHDASLAVKDTRITAQNAIALNRRRQEKAQAKLRAAVVQATRDKLAIPADVDLTSGDAVAAAGGILWGDVVLTKYDEKGQPIYPRDRLDAWQKIGERAGILASAAEQRAAEPSSPGIRVELDASTAAALLAMLERVRQSSMEAEATDAETE